MTSGNGSGCDEVANPSAELPDLTPCPNSSSGLRPIVIDGSNLAISHGNKREFSCRGIRLAVDWFKRRGHKEITVFVPQWRRENHKQDLPIIEPEILQELEQEKILAYTPSRRVQGKRIVCYDDRYIVRLAAENGGIIVSNDNYRDLAAESPEYQKAIEERLLMYTFVNDRFMPPEDPLGRRGPTLDNFLRFESLGSRTVAPPCPYGKRCTYGVKCRYFHPERQWQTCRRGSRSDASPKHTACSPSLSCEAPSSPHIHPKTRLTRSDPADPRVHTDIKCGHLELATKLSDEYKKTGQNEMPKTGGAGHAMDFSDLGLSQICIGSRRPQPRPAASSFNVDVPNTHRKLVRQPAAADETVIPGLPICGNAPEPGTTYPNVSEVDSVGNLVFQGRNISMAASNPLRTESPAGSESLHSGTLYTFQPPLGYSPALRDESLNYTITSMHRSFSQPLAMQSTATFMHSPVNSYPFATHFVIPHTFSASQMCCNSPPAAWPPLDAGISHPPMMWTLPLGSPTQHYVSAEGVQLAMSCGSMDGSGMSYNGPSTA